MKGVEICWAIANQSIRIRNIKWLLLNLIPGPKYWPDHFQSNFQSKDILQANQLTMKQNEQFNAAYDRHQLMMSNQSYNREQFILQSWITQINVSMFNEHWSALAIMRHTRRLNAKKCQYWRASATSGNTFLYADQ